MQTLTFQIQDSRDRNLLVAILRRFGIEPSEVTVKHEAGKAGNTFFGNAKKHIAKSTGETSPTLSADIDSMLYGG